MTTTHPAAHPNAQLMTKVYDAFTRGDLQAASQYWTDDCIHHYPGRNPLSGSHQGLESATEFATKMFELTQGRVHMEIREIGASDNHAFALVHTHYQRDTATPAPTPRELTMQFVNVARIQGGKIAEFWTYPDDQHAVDEFWS